MFYNIYKLKGTHSRVSLKAYIYILYIKRMFKKFIDFVRAIIIISSFVNKAERKEYVS